MGEVAIIVGSSGGSNAETEVVRLSVLSFEAYREDCGYRKGYCTEDRH
jgi:hypothetical protein